MRAVFLVAILAGLIIGGVVAGVRVVSGGGDDKGGSPATATAAKAEERTPASLAAEFAKAWTAESYDALYLLLDADSQRAFPQATFVAEYRSFANELTQAAVTATVAAVDGSNARLSVHVATAYFGDLEYTTSLNLSRSSGRWLVAWDRHTIHPDMTGGRSFKSTIQRPKRGAILDRNGSPLAITQDVRLLGLNRSAVTNRAALTAQLVQLGFTQAQVDAAFAAPGGATQRVTVGAVPDEKAEAAALALRTVPGVLLYFESQRVHPLGAAAAHVVGYTRELTAEELAKRQGQGYRIGDRVGAVGLEASQEKVLAGQAGSELSLVEADGATTVKQLASREYVAGQDVTTTLDAGVLRAAAARLGTRAGAAVVIDPRTNNILALNSSPSFDPDAFERNDSAALNAIAAAPGAPQTNRATSGLYSGGSTFKLVTGAAGLSSGKYKTTDQIFCGATWNGVDPPRKNWEGTQGLLTIAQGLMRSCNSVFYEIALTLYDAGDGALSKMARLFGYGASTGTVGLNDEGGLVPDAAWKTAKKGEQWYPGDEVNLGIGQGDLLITPLQLANAYSTFLAGELRVPVLLAGQPATSRGKLPLTPEQSAHLKLGLKLVTSATGTASAAFALSGYTDFGGKSGTAEDAGSQQHVLFVAFSPADTPRAVAAVVLDDGQSGSIEAGPIARDIVLVAIK
ncbi:MAG: hypothetical protein HYX53_13740 [Chloroflexi bacterium]|nr:hypothetical protein [Chloroflexota bacterium]